MINGVPTRLFRGGRGMPALVLAPELVPSRWFPYHEDLAARFLVLAPEHPGFGASERPEWLEGVDDLVLHYLDFLDELELEQVAIIGSSLGGWIAAEIAVLQPKRVTHLVLAGAAGLKVDGARRHDVFLNPIEKTMAVLFHDPSRAAQLLSDESGVDRILRGYREGASLARLAWNPYLYNPKLERRLRRIACPTLVVWGENDRFLDAAHGAAFARLIPKARLEQVPACGHLVAFEQTATFSRLAGDFLATAVE